MTTSSGAPRTRNRTPLYHQAEKNSAKLDALRQEAAAEKKRLQQAAERGGQEADREISRLRAQVEDFQRELDERKRAHDKEKVGWSCGRGSERLLRCFLGVWVAGVIRWRGKHSTSCRRCTWCCRWIVSIEINDCLNKCFPLAPRRGQTSSVPPVRRTLGIRRP